MINARAAYHRPGWKPKTLCTVVAENTDGTVDLADDCGEVFVTSLPVYDGEGDPPAISYATVESETAPAPEKAPAPPAKKTAKKSTRKSKSKAK